MTHPARLSDFRLVLQHRLDLVVEHNVLPLLCVYCRFYFENFVTKRLKRESLDRNEIIAIFEDYKIGSCILQVLRRYYEFQTPTFDAFKSASNFSREGITSPSELRVFLFNQINEDETGFLSSENKQS